MPHSASDIFAILRNPQRHKDFDGSHMITGSLTEELIRAVGDTFTMRMNRAGDDYLMINFVDEFDENRRIFWTPAPGDISRAEGHEEANIGKPAGYRWGYILEPMGMGRTKVTEVFEFGPLTESNFTDGGTWINTKNTVQDSMMASLKLLAGLI